MCVAFPGISKGLTVGGFYQRIHISIMKQLLCPGLLAHRSSGRGTRLTEGKGNGERGQTECG